VEFRAEARWVRSAPRKAQLVVAEIRGLSVADAGTLLRFTPKAVARDIVKVLDSAVANAGTHPEGGFAPEDLYVSAAIIGAGPTLKRWQARARGRVGRIHKRTCHITIRVAPIEGAVAGRRAPAAAAPASSRTSRGKAKAAPEAAVLAEQPLVEPEAAAVEAPKRTPAKRKPKESGEAAVQETAEGEPEATEAKPRVRRKSAEAETSGTSEETPKPRRSGAKKADEPAQGEEQS
jgi:large subunit ribosomal protein L22